jgi:hypothetical protein
METIELGSPAGARAAERPGASAAETTKIEDAERPVGAAATRSVVARWLLNDIFFIAMLILALVGVIFRLPVTYWLILTPVFGLISIFEGWSHFSTRSERLGLAYRVAAIWGALLLSIYLLFNSGVQGVLNANGTSLAMITLLALGTFVAGVQARVWQICAVGGLLFLAVPGVGWLDQSPLLLAAATMFIIAMGGLIWWVKEMQSASIAAAASNEAVPPHIVQDK